MFTSRRQLVRKSGKKGIDRFEFLQELVNEFYQSTSLDSQEQVLANLANFAYDPLNYHYLRELKVVELFLSGLQSRNPFFIEYSLKGICNLSNDPINQEIILKHDGFGTIKELLKSENPELVKHGLTTLIFLLSSASPSVVSTSDLVTHIRFLQQNSENQNIKNLATIFLEESTIH
ncbi:armadillo repeat-containing protein 7 isoform X1 [Daphnia magna]|uniref:Armadillo repeat-containing protein n=1 Tax=Daphnia magna TaxID=35525 RepID=A0A165A892_9CRUS|nr:armadillo repeat-containing protein 7 isoform X1 [Daphnia magna]KZS17289.1 Armadillo repeat-containing protein [Daphnia magna]